MPCITKDCKNVVEKGNVYCSSCLEQKKNDSKNRQQTDILSFLQQINGLSAEITKLKENEQKHKEIAIKNEELKKNLDLKCEEYEEKIRNLMKTHSEELDSASNSKTSVMYEKLKYFHGEAVKELSELKASYKNTCEERDEFAVFLSSYKKENERLMNIINELRSQVEKLEDDKAKYEISHEQLKLDIKRLEVENEKLSKKLESTLAKISTEDWNTSSDSIP